MSFLKIYNLSKEDFISLKPLRENSNNSRASFEILSSKDDQDIDIWKIQKSESESLLEFNLRFQQKILKLESYLRSNFLLELHNFLDLIEKKDLSEKEVQRVEVFIQRISTFKGDVTPFVFFKNSFEITDKEEGLFILDFEGRDYEFFKKEDKEIIYLCYLVFIRNYSLMNAEYYKNQVKLVLEDFFNQINLPMVLFNSFNDLYLHNKAYRDLNILTSETLSVENGGKFEKNGQVFTVKVEDFEFEDQEYKLFVFSKEMSFSDNYIDSNELGIISGSIAHELNNPIGAILSGVDVLKMIATDINDDLKSILDEMKKSALRSSGLVKTFLGFSKKEILPEAKTQISESMDQASAFLRTRLVENNILLNIKYSEVESRIIENRSIWTMIFYILFSNSLNMLLRDKLISSNQSNQLNVSMTGRKKELVFSINKKIDKAIFDELLLSTFFFHLLEREKLKVALEERGLIFTNEK